MKRIAFAVPPLVVAIFSTCLLITTDANAQSGSRVYPATPSYPVAPRRSFEARFWDYVKGAKYTNWAPGPGQNGDFYEGESPHGAYLKMYLNRAAAGSPADMPHGTWLGGHQGELWRRQKDVGGCHGYVSCQGIQCGCR